MKKLTALLLVTALLCTLLPGCGDDTNDPSTGPSGGDPPAASAPLGDGDDAFGDSLEDLNVYEGYFEEDAAEITVTCVSGTPGCCSLEGGTLTFTSVSEDSVYAVSGRLKGNIVIDAGDDFKFDLELQGLSLVSDAQCPIMILSGDEVSLTAKKGTVNYIYDTRDAVDPDDETQYSGAVYSKVDLEVCGKGTLTLVSANNNGIHSKDDLQVKNLTLLVACTDNALKGNDSVEITSGTLTLIATRGDGIKTSNTDISGKGNQRGTVTVSGADVTVYAACDGIDAAYNAVVDGETTVLNIYTDRYSNYSSEVTAVDSDSYYIRFTSRSYSYSVKYYNSDDDYCWVNAVYDSTVSGGRTNYYYYAVEKLEAYEKMKFFIYNSGQQQGQEEDYLAASDYLTPNAGYDTFALSSQMGGLSYTWTNYTTKVDEGGPGGPGGPGGGFGMGEGNPDKGDYSTKGIKADNEILIAGGTVSIKSYDDALHANNDVALENGQTPTGNVTVSGGNLTLCSNDDGIHADGTATVSGGSVNIISSYEGVEGNDVVISGGSVSIRASDDGVNATAASGAGVTISGGDVYICCTGDGIDANSRSSYAGIVFSGGRTVVISNSGMNSAIDTEAGYVYEGGQVLAVMPAGGMTGEATHCANFSSVATSAAASLRSGGYLIVEVGGEIAVAVEMPAAINARVIYLCSNSASVSTDSAVSAAPDANGVFWAD